jgi:hypothetical protein
MERGLCVWLGGGARGSRHLLPSTGDLFRGIGLGVT